MKSEFHGLLEEHTEGLRKLLYLQGQYGLVVEVDGPALRIEQPQRANMLYPLVRLARVLSKGGVHWSCEALLACAEAGIPVVFLDGEGGVRGYLFGASSGEDTLYLRLRSCVRRPDGLDRYIAWRRTMAAHAQRALEQQLRQADGGVGATPGWQGLTPISWWAAIAPTDAVMNRRLGGLLAGLSAQLWVEAGLNAKRLVSLEPLSLLDDLADLLGWALAKPLLTALRRWNEGESKLDMRDEQSLTALVELHRGEIFRFGWLLLDGLEKWLEER